MIRKTNPSEAPRVNAPVDGRIMHAEPCRIMVVKILSKL